jgi:hypothetical protein
MALANQFIPPPGAYSEEVGWGRGERNLLKLIIGQRNKLFCKLDNFFILVFICLPTLLPPKQWYCASPRASWPAHIHSILSSIPDACFWLVVVWAIVDRWPTKGNGVFYIYFFLHLNLSPQTIGRRHPTCSNPHAPPLQHLPYRSRQQLFDCCIFQFNCGHLRPRHHFFSIFWCILIFPPQVNKPLHRQTRSRAPCMGPEGYVAPLVGGANSLPMERGQSRWRVGWRRLMLVVVCFVCCVLWLWRALLATLLVEMSRLG